MLIAVNTRLLLKGKLEGIGRFTFEALKRITRDHPEHQFLFIFDRNPSEEFIFSSNVIYVVAHPQARHPILWYLYFEWGVKKVLDTYKPDLFLSPDGWLSLKSDVKSLPVIHDLNFEAHPEFLPWHIRKYYHYFFPRFARKAKRIATVSEYTASDISNRYSVDRALIDVVYNGADASFKQLDLGVINQVRKTYTDSKPYFLFVGLIHPRKNLEKQLNAFEKFKLRTKSDYKFLVVGAMHWQSKQIKEFLAHSPAANDVVFTGRKEFQELVKIYGAAHALLYASYFEGFGIPILEAMKSGVPVITSNRTSMPEVLGDAGITVDPSSDDQIADAMNYLFSNKEGREELIKKGLKRAQKFNWDDTASRLWESIEKALRD